MACCGQQFSKTIKTGSDACFSCLGGSQEHLLEKGHLYPICSPLVEGPTKQDAWRPMSDPTECIVGFIGPNCTVDAADWADDKMIHVYPHAVAIKQRVCWPADAAGASLFTQAEIDTIVHAHHCCIAFDKELSCQQAPAWLAAQQTTTA